MATEFYNIIFEIPYNYEDEYIVGNGWIVMNEDRTFRRVNGIMFEKKDDQLYPVCRMHTRNSTEVEGKYVYTFAIDDPESPYKDQCLNIFNEVIEKVNKDFGGILIQE